MVASQAGVVNMHILIARTRKSPEEIGYTLEGASMRGAGGKVVSNAIPEALEAIAVQLVVLMPVLVVQTLVWFSST